MQFVGVFNGRKGTKPYPNNISKGNRNGNAVNKIAVKKVCEPWKRLQTKSRAGTDRGTGFFLSYAIKLINCENISERFPVAEAIWENAAVNLGGGENRGAVSGV